MKNQHRITMLVSVLVAASACQDPDSAADGDRTTGGEDGSGTPSYCEGMRPFLRGRALGGELECLEPPGSLRVGHFGTTEVRRMNFIDRCFTEAGWGAVQERLIERTGPFSFNYTLTHETSLDVGGGLDLTIEGVGINLTGRGHERDEVTVRTEFVDVMNVGLINLVPTLRQGDRGEEAAQCVRTMCRLTAEGSGQVTSAALEGRIQIRLETQNASELDVEARVSAEGFGLTFAVDADESNSEQLVLTSTQRVVLAARSVALGPLLEIEDACVGGGENNGPSEAP